MNDKPSPELEKIIERVRQKVGAADLAKATIARIKIAEACGGVRADLALAALTFSIGQIFHATAATEGIDRQELLKLIVRMVDTAIDAGPDDTFLASERQQPAVEPKTIPKKKSPWN